MIFEDDNDDQSIGGNRQQEDRYIKAYQHRLRLLEQTLDVFGDDVLPEVVPDGHVGAVNRHREHPFVEQFPRRRHFEWFNNSLVLKFKLVTDCSYVTMSVQPSSQYWRDDVEVRGCRHVCSCEVLSEKFIRVFILYIPSRKVYMVFVGYESLGGKKFEEIQSGFKLERKLRAMCAQDIYEIS